MKKPWPVSFIVSAVGFGCWCLLYACSGTQVADTAQAGPPTVEIDKEVHFLTPEGEDVVVQPGAYEVRAEKEGVRLVADESDESGSLLIEATSITHEEKANAPTALSYSEQEDEHIVMLLLPNGKGLEAQGSYSGIQKRALRTPTLRRQQVRRQFDIRKKLKLKPTQLALSAVSVKYSSLKRPYTGRKSRNTWRLPVSDTLHRGTFTFVWIHNTFRMVPVTVGGSHQVQVEMYCESIQLTKFPGGSFKSLPKLKPPSRRRAPKRLRKGKGFSRIQKEK